MATIASVKRDHPARRRFTIRRRCCSGPTSTYCFELLMLTTREAPYIHVAFCQFAPMKRPMLIAALLFAGGCAEAEGSPANQSAEQQLASNRETTAKNDRRRGVTGRGPRVPGTSSTTSTESSRSSSRHAATVTGHRCSRPSSKYGTYAEEIVLRILERPDAGRQHDVEQDRGRQEGPRLLLRNSPELSSERIRCAHEASRSRGMRSGGDPSSRRSPRLTIRRGPIADVASATADTVKLRNGGMMRGRVTRNRPRRPRQHRPLRRQGAALRVERGRPRELVGGGGTAGEIQGRRRRRLARRQPLPRRPPPIEAGSSTSTSSRRPTPRRCIGARGGRRTSSSRASRRATATCRSATPTGFGSSGITTTKEFRPRGRARERDSGSPSTGPTGSASSAEASSRSPASGSAISG